MNGMMSNGPSNVSWESCYVRSRARSSPPQWLGALQIRSISSTSMS